MIVKLFNFSHIHVYLSILVILVCAFGDYAVINSTLLIQKALFDNATHSVIGGLSWLVVSVTNNSRNSANVLIETTACALFSSFIDLDHFFAAQSLYLKNAVGLQKRPPLHCSTFPLAICSMMFVFGSFLHLKWLINLSLIIFVAFASHHTRDATRRGFWFGPFGSTPPISCFLYVAITVAIPYVVVCIQRFFKLHDVVDSAYQPYVV